MSLSQFSMTGWSDDVCPLLRGRAIIDQIDVHETAQLDLLAVDRGGVKALQRGHADTRNPEGRGG